MQTCITRRRKAEGGSIHWGNPLFVNPVLFVLSIFAFVAPATAADLQDAVWRSDLAEVTRLIEGGIDVNRRLAGGQCPLHAAVVGGDVRVLEALMDAGADLECIDRKGSTPLILAAKLGQLEIIRSLLAAGARIDRRDWEGRTAAQAALRRSHSEIAKLIGQFPVASPRASSRPKVEVAPSNLPEPTPSPRRGTSGKRVALVVGNSAYLNTPPLDNPKRDAEAIARKLHALGFDVSVHTDLSGVEMLSAVREFGERLREVDLSLFYYAGHAVQVGGENFLLPVDAEIRREADLAYDAVLVDLVMSEMERSDGTRVLILDSCRDNPFHRQIAANMPAGRSASRSRGLALSKRATAGSLIAYATSPDSIAADGEGAHSPYTAALLNWIDRPNVELGELFRRVRSEVMQSTSGKQMPWEHSSLVGDPVYLSVGEE